jgi:hypothetical protein
MGCLSFKDVDRAFNNQFLCYDFTEIFHMNSMSKVQANFYFLLVRLFCLIKFVALLIHFLKTHLSCLW